MTTSNQSGKLLVVDTSTAMLHVLKNFTARHGYDADHFSDPDDACERLDQRFQNFSCDYRGVILGWPEGRLNLVNELLQKLGSTDHDTMPLMVIAQEMNADIRALVKRRPKTRAFLWSEYQQVADVIDLTAKHQSKRKTDTTVVAAFAQPATPTSIHAPIHTTNDAPIHAMESAEQGIEPAVQQSNIAAAAYSSSFSLMLVDTIPSICESLRKKLETSGYEVTVVSSVAEAREQIVDNQFDIIVTDFFLRDESGEALCQYLQNSELESKPVCVVLTAKYSDSIVKRSLAVGAAACLYKNESTELLFARIDALTRTLRRQSRQLSQQLLQLQTRQIPPPNEVEAGDVIKESRIVSLHTATHTRLQADAESASGASRSGVVGHQSSEKPTGDSTEISAVPVVPQAQSKLEKAVDKSGIAEKRRKEHSPANGVIVKAGPVRVTRKANKEIATHSTPGRQAEDKVALAESVNAAADSSGQLQEQTPQAKMSAQEPRLTELDIRVPETELLAQLKNRNLAAQYSLLMLDIEIVAATGDRMVLSDSEPMQKLVARSLLKLYPKQKAQACTEDGKFVLLLTTPKFQDALVLTRKILQLIPKVVPYLSNMDLVTHAGILRIEKEGVLDESRLINRCRAACQKTRKDGKDNAALVLPNNQYLSALVSQPDVSAIEVPATRGVAPVVNDKTAKTVTDKTAKTVNSKAANTVNKPEEKERPQIA